LTLRKSGIIVITIVQCAMVRIGRFLGEDTIMSTTALEARGPNKALYRTAALAGSAIIWGSLGYLALSYVPQIQKPFERPEPPPIVSAPKPIEITLPPPPVVKPDDTKPPPIIREQDPIATPPTITTRDVPNARPTNMPRDLPSGPPPSRPATTGDAEQGAIAGPIEIPIVLPEPEIIVPPLPEPVPIPAPPPMPKLVINPVKASGANPVFPNRPLEAGISGEVTLSFTVTPSGRVDNITILSETPRRYGFAKAAEDAIATWTFQPQTIDGVPVAYPARYTISFKLED
jgi:periplasmic protein TonB